MNNFTSYTSLAEGNNFEAGERKFLGETLCPFGISYLDDAFGGICRNDLILLGGRSGIGKSELAAHIAMNAALAGKKVFYFGLEFAPLELNRRIIFKKLTQRYFADPDRVQGRPDFLDWMLNKQEHLFEKYYRNVIAEIDPIRNLLIRHRTSDFTLEDLERNIISERDCDLFIIDHLHYFDFKEGENENAGAKRIMKAIANHVDKYQRPFIVVSHIRKGDRKSEQIIPTIEDFHGSSDIFKVATRTITIAPGKQVEGMPHIWSTYMWANKDRWAGARTNYCALTAFNSKKNTYEEKYEILKINRLGTETKTVTETEKPSWAARGFVCNQKAQSMMWPAQSVVPFYSRSDE